MKSTLAGKTPAISEVRGGVRVPILGETSRLDYLWQMVASVSHRLYGFRIPCLLGFLAFTNTIAFEQPFSPLSGDYESTLVDIAPKGGSHLWDALEKGLNNLKALTAAREYPNVRAVRILVFADGADSGSTIDKVALANALIAAKVVVDSVLLTSAERDASPDLTRLSRLTGGFAYQIQPGDEVLSLFERESFLISSKRPATVVADLPVTPEAFDKTPFHFDTNLDNMELVHASARIEGLHTPAYRLTHPPDRPTPRTERILLELRGALIHQRTSGDNSIRLYVNNRDFSEWKAFLLGPAGTQYGGVWWHLSVLFPEGYPIVPPIMRFVTIPHHMNVSEDGRICMDGLCQKYHLGKTVMSLILEVKELFTVPQLDLAVSVAKRLDFRLDEAGYNRQSAESCEGAIPDLDRHLRGTKITDDPSYIPAPVPAPEPDAPAYPPIDTDLMVEDAEVVRLVRLEGRALRPLSEDDCI
jgi:ubiquitin-protein ligase